MSAHNKMEGSFDSLPSGQERPPSLLTDEDAASSSTRSTISAQTSSTNLSSLAASNASIIPRLCSYVLVFGPQGTGAVLTGPHTLSDLAAAGGNVAQTLLSEAHQAFVEELNHARANKEPCIESIAVPESLEDFCILCNPHQSHQAVSNVMTALGQALTVMAVARSNKIPLETLLSPSTELSIAALCTGVIAGYAFAAATRPSELVFRTVEALRLAFWLGLRACQCADSISSRASGEVAKGMEDATWCMGAAACSIERMDDLISRFATLRHDKNGDTGGEGADGTSPVQLMPWITVVSSSDKLSIGGPPAVLSAFRDFAAGAGIRLRAVHLNTPYHNAKVLQGAAEAVRRDVDARNIQLPNGKNLPHTFYDNRTGTVAGPDGGAQSVVDLIVASMLLDRARWDLIRNGLSARALSTNLPAVTVINAGPDAWYASDLLQSIKRPRDEKCRSFVPATTVLALKSSPVKGREGGLAASQAGTPLDPHLTAVTAAFTAIVPAGTQVSPSETLEKWAAQLNSQAPLASFAEAAYADHLGAFFNDVAAFPEENLGLLRRLVASHGWPEPSLLGRVPGSTVAPAIQRGCEALERGLCNIALVGGVEIAPDHTRRAFSLVLERASDATATGHRVQALIVKASCDHEDPAAAQHALDSALMDVDSPIYYVNNESSIERHDRMDISAKAIARRGQSDIVALESALDFCASNGDPSMSAAPSNDASACPDSPRTVVFASSVGKKLSTVTLQSPSEEHNGRNNAEKGHIRLIGLSAGNKEQLAAARSDLLNHLRGQHMEGPEADATLDSLSFTTLARPHPDAFRVALPVSNLSDLIRNLQKAAEPQNFAIRNPSRRVAFIFPGQGCQYHQMAQALHRDCKPFRESIETCERLCKAQGFSGFLASMLSTSVSEGTSEAETSTREQADQLAIFAIEVSLAKLLQSWGINPSCVSGHSLGHYAASYIAGVLSLSDALYLVARRSTLFQQLCAPQESQMLAVSAPEERVLQIVTDAGSSATIACFNSKTDLILSGERSELKQLVQKFKSSGVKAKLLDVPFGFHSEHVAPAMHGMLRAAQKVTVHPPKIAITSNVLGRVVQPGEKGVFDAEYFAKHLRQPVRFASAIEEAHKTLGLTDCFELGPHPICSPMVKATLGANTVSIFPGMRKNTCDWSVLLSSLGTYWSLGGTIGWRKCLLSLGKRYTVSHSLLPTLERTLCPRMSLGSLLASPSPSATSTSLQRSGYFETPVPAMTAQQPWLHHLDRDQAGKVRFTTPLTFFADAVRAHRVVGLPVFSASLHGELALQAMAWATRSRATDLHGVQLKDLTFFAPLVVPAESDTRDAVSSDCSVHLELSYGSRDTCALSAFTVQASQPGSPAKTHLSGKVLLPTASALRGVMRSDAAAAEALQRLHTLERDSRAPTSGFSVLSAELLYKLFQARVDYCPQFHALRSVALPPSECSHEAIGTVTVPDQPSLSGRPSLQAFFKDTILHPVLHDVMLHFGGFMLNQSALVETHETFIGAKVGEILFSNVDAIIPQRTYRIYASVKQLSKNDFETNTYLFDGEGAQVVGWARGVIFRKMRTSVLQGSLQRAIAEVGAAPAIAQPQEVGEDIDDPYAAVWEQIRAAKRGGSERVDSAPLQAVGATVEASDASLQEKADALLLKVFPHLRGAHIHPVAG